MRSEDFRENVSLAVSSHHASKSLEILPHTVTY